MKQTQEEILDQCMQGFEIAPNASTEERESILSSIYSAMSTYAGQEQEVGLLSASQQFTGWSECRSNGQIINLVISMGLTSDEWISIKEDWEHGLTLSEVQEIDDHFS